jgi:hypothetical protein
MRPTSGRSRVDRAPPGRGASSHVTNARAALLSPRQTAQLKLLFSRRALHWRTRQARRVYARSDARTLYLQNGRELPNVTSHRGHLVGHQLPSTSAARVLFGDTPNSSRSLLSPGRCCLINRWLGARVPRGAGFRTRRPRRPAASPSPLATHDLRPARPGPDQVQSSPHRSPASAGSACPGRTRRHHCARYGP